MSDRPTLARLTELVEVPRDLLLGRYPPFVSGGPLLDGDVPVFVFHSVEPERFGAQLDHLARNGYAALSMDQYLAHLTGRQTAPRRAVLLTFDDARGSLWSVGAPLLRRHGMRGVAFVVPGRVTSRVGPPLPSLDATDSATSPRPDVLAREDRDGPLLYWEEIDALSKENLFDFESHTYSHSRVHVAPDIVGFVTAERRVGYRAFDLALQREGDRDLLGEEIPLGAPMLRSAPRLSEERRAFENPDARRACADAVCELGGRCYFAKPGWERELLRIARRFPATVGVETLEDRATAVERELVDARLAIEERTGRPVRHLCYPWHTTSPLARSLARSTGHLTAFCGKVRGRTISRPGDDLLSIARLGQDWVELLPGRGRLSLREVLWSKWTRRINGRA